MGILESSTANLRFAGDDLVPSHVTSLLGHSPSGSQLKGEVLRVSKDRTRISKTGCWRLSATARQPADLESQVFEILSMLTPDLTVWASLAPYEPDLFCGIFMASGNDGLPLSSKALLALAQRGISLDLDIYHAGD
ncbi:MULTISPECIES: DUF4279 domain-containing protein [Xanthomonas]|uniref:DUF4279 domain-containing protein n=1 Tax=Xanthomonas cannabis TaxID=1885674 RepID=UPI00160F82EB|nr:DUF4279 domain-containing protein [Xanthomonas cannabis]